MKQCVPALVFFSAIALSLSVLTPDLAYAVDNAALRAINAKTTGKATLHRDASGHVTHLRTATTPLAVDPSLNPDVRARRVLNQYRDAFLDSSVPLELVTTRVAPLDPSGRSYVRYQQHVNGIPVRGGNVIVHLEKRGVTAVHAKLHSGLNAIATTPGVSSEQALAAAERSIATLFPKSRVRLTTPRLEIVNPSQLRGKEDGLARLAWFTEANATSVREFVWIDAERGDILLHFSQVAHASAVSVSDYAGSCLDPAPVGMGPYDNNNLPPSGSDAEAGYNNITATYDYFANTFAWLGLDGGDVKSQVAIVRICDADPAFASAPEKAEWSKASDSPDAQGQMLFASGVTAADDIVAHEYTHGVIEYSSSMNLLRQSGALAEGFADVFGEAVDQIQNTTNDTGDAKWAFGEDAPGGPFRNLLSPGDNALPGKVTDSNFYCGADESLWIHRNGAVIAHAFALLADGGTYNGFTITGIGAQKAARIFFNTMTAHLTDSSSFQDAYSGFKAAADLLVTSGTITSSDRAQVVKVLDAVELNAAPCSTHLNYCPAGQTAVSLFSDDFENVNSGKWTNEVTTGVNHWSDAGNDGAGVGTPAVYFAADSSKGADPSGLVAKIGISPYRGSYALWAATETRAMVAGRFGESNVAMTNAVTLAVGANTNMQFEGRFAFEQSATVVAPDGSESVVGPDGGIVEYSVGGGAWQNATSLISAGQGYTGTIQSDQVPPNPLALYTAFVGSSPSAGYASTRLDLTSLAGQLVKFRFRVGTDRWVEAMGWQIDDVNIYTCSDAALVVTPVEGLTTSESSGTATFTVRLGGKPSESVTLKIESSNTGEGSVDKAELVFDSSNYSVDQMVTITGVDDSVNDGDVAYTVTVSVDQTNDTGYKSAPSVDVSVTNTNNDQSKRGGGGGSIGLSLLLALLFLTLARAAPRLAVVAAVTKLVTVQKNSRHFRARVI